VDDRSLLERAEPLEQMLVQAAERAGMRVVAARFHQFKPHGATGVLLLEQSHLAIHTWVEEGLACVDLMTCGDADPEVCLTAIRQALPGEHQVVSIERRAPKRGQVQF
jgi:S-adenosylmethionine decarboxylase proenzyme